LRLIDPEALKPPREWPRVRPSSKEALPPLTTVMAGNDDQLPASQGPALWTSSVRNPERAKTTTSYN